MKEPEIMGKSALAVGNRIRRQWLYGKHLGKCFYCGNPVINPNCSDGRDWLFIDTHGSRMVREHKVPTSRGGGSEAANVAPSCSACNTQKGAFTADEFRLVRSLRAGTLNCRFAFEPPVAVARDWLCPHSQSFVRTLVIHNIPSASEAYAMRNGWARQEQLNA